MTSPFSRRVTELNLKLTLNSLEMKSKKVSTGDKSCATADKTHKTFFFLHNGKVETQRSVKNCPLV